MSLALVSAIIALGYLGIFVTIFAESGIFLGFFLPGDSLLFTAGILASQGYFSITYLIIGTALAAILGDSFGYWMGKRFGPALFRRDDSFLFKKKYVLRTEEFFKRYGKKAIVLARFMPIIRTFIPVLAGIGSMEYKTFLSYNIIGGALWAGGFLGVSYYLGRRFGALEQYLTLIIIAIIVISFLPLVFEFLRKKK